MNLIYIKAMLDCYKHIDKLADALDKRVMDIALKSSGFDGNFRPCSHYIKDITNFTNQKINLINIKVIIMDMIKSLPYKYRLVAKYRYIDCLKVSEIAQCLGLSVRSIFRLLRQVPEYCEKYLNSSGLDDKWFWENFGNKKWMTKYLKSNQTAQKTQNSTCDYPKINVLPVQDNQAFLGLNIK